jgi:superoxide dismutase, Cu-Zn family
MRREVVAMYITPTVAGTHRRRRPCAVRTTHVVRSAAAWLALALGSCSVSEDPAVERQLAGALVEARNGSALAGFITVKRRSGVVRLFLNVLNAPPGDHGVHLHAAGDCAALDSSPNSPHWNPEAHPHGSTVDAAHLGDLGNLHVDEAGRGLLTFSSAAFGLGDGTEFDILGRALVIRERADDLVTQPTGNAGLPLGCGVIR